jgi:hypothetical protein
LTLKILLKSTFSRKIYFYIFFVKYNIQPSAVYLEVILAGLHNMHQAYSMVNARLVGEHLHVGCPHCVINFSRIFGLTLFNLCSVIKDTENVHLTFYTPT